MHGRKWALRAAQLTSRAKRLNQLQCVSGGKWTQRNSQKVDPGVNGHELSSGNTGHAITFLSESRNGAVNELGFHERRGASSED